MFGLAVIRIRLFGLRDVRINIFKLAVVWIKGVLWPVLRHIIALLGILAPVLDQYKKESGSFF